MVPPRFSKKTARMSTGGNAPRRVLGVRRQPRRIVAVLPRRSLRIARHNNVIDAVTESVLIHSEAKRPRRRRHKLTALRPDGSRANRTQLATRAAARAYALHAGVQSACALSAFFDARNFANDAMGAAHEAARIHAQAEAQRLANVAAAEQAMRADVEHARATALLSVRLRSIAEDRARARAAALEAREVPVGPDPEETEVEDCLSEPSDVEAGIFSDYEPSSPVPARRASDYPPSPIHNPRDPAASYVDLTIDDDDIECGQPLSPCVLYVSDSE